jgi:hypothetical protein
VPNKADGGQVLDRKAEQRAFYLSFR